MVRTMAILCMAGDTVEIDRILSKELSGSSLTVLTDIQVKINGLFLF